MIKNLIIIVLLIALILTIVFEEQAIAAVECPKEPYEQNQMVDGCVMQKSHGTWIRTCG